MPVIPPLNADDVSADLQATLDKLEHHKPGSPNAGFRMMGRAPALAADALENQLAVLHADDDVLDARTREALVLAASIANGCADCVRAHVKRAQSLGWSEADVTAIFGIVAEAAMLNAYHRHRELDPSLGLPLASGLSFKLLDHPPIDRRTAELIAVVVSGIHGCPQCVGHHTTRARAVGVTDEQLREAVRVGATMTLFNTFFRVQ